MKKQTPDILAELRERAGRRPSGSVPKLGAYLQRMPEDEAAEWREALADETIPGAVIAELMTERQYPIGEQSIRRWRKRLRRDVS